MLIDQITTISSKEQDYSKSLSSSDQNVKPNSYNNRSDNFENAYNKNINKYQNVKETTSSKKLNENDNNHREISEQLEPKESTEARVNSDQSDQVRAPNQAESSNKVDEQVNSVDNNNKGQALPIKGNQLPQEFEIVQLGQNSANKQITAKITSSSVSDAQSISHSSQLNTDKANNVHSNLDAKVSSSLNTTSNATSNTELDNSAQKKQSVQNQSFDRFSLNKRHMILSSSNNTQSTLLDEKTQTNQLKINSLNKLDKTHLSETDLNSSKLKGLIQSGQGSNQKSAQSNLNLSNGKFSVEQTINLKSDLLSGSKLKLDRKLSSEKLSKNDVSKLHVGDKNYKSDNSFKTIGVGTDGILSEGSKTVNSSQISKQTDSTSINSLNAKNITNSLKHQDKAQASSANSINPLQTQTSTVENNQSNNSVDFGDASKLTEKTKEGQIGLSFAHHPDSFLNKMQPNSRSTPKTRQFSFQPVTQSTTAANAPLTHSAHTESIDTSTQTQVSQATTIGSEIISHRTPSQNIPISVASSHLNQKFSEHVSMLVLKGATSAQIRLDPPELGPMAVKIHHNGAETQIQFIINHPVAREIIDSSLNRLKDNLEQHGFYSVDVDVTDSQEQTTHQANQDAIENEVLHDQTTDAPDQLVKHQAITSDGLIDLFA